MANYFPEITPSTDIFSMDFIDDLIQRAKNSGQLTEEEQNRIKKIRNDLIPKFIDNSERDAKVKKLYDQYLKRVKENKRLAFSYLYNRANYKQIINQYIKNKNKYESAVINKENLVEILNLYFTYLMRKRAIFLAREKLRLIQNELTAQELRKIKEDQNDFDQIEETEKDFDPVDEDYVDYEVQKLIAEEPSLLDAYETAKEQYKEAKQQGNPGLADYRAIKNSLMDAMLVS